MARGKTIAKLTRPRAFDVAMRERLFAVLDDLRRTPAIWVTGPPGAGKTTLVSSYLDARQLPALWYQVDAGDSDISSLFYFMTEAAKNFAPRKRRLPLFTPEYLPDVSGFARRYFRELLSRLPTTGTIVLDNCHEASEDPSFLAVLVALVTETASGTTIFLVSREQPPARLMHLVANRHLSIVDWNTLKLTLDETQSIVRLWRPVDLSMTERLHRRCDGWAAGLVLLLTCTDGGECAAELTGPATHEATFGYFASQAFDEAPTETRLWLMQLATLPVVTISLAQALTGNGATQRLLDTLYRRNLFLERRPGREPTFHFHSLFRAFLLARAAERIDAPELLALKLRAARLLEQESLPDHAFQLFIEAGDTASATRLLLSRASTLFAEGRWRTLRDAIERLPHELIEAEPWLGYWLGLTEFQLDQAQSRRTLSAVYDQFEKRRDRIGQMLTAASILTGFYFEYVNWTPADPWIERLGTLIEDGPSLPTPELELTVYSAMLYGIAIRQTDHPMLESCTEQTMAILRRDIETNSRLLGGLAVTGPVCCMLGAFDLFKEARTLLGPLVNRPEVTDLHRAAWFMTTGCKLYMNAENETAFNDLEEGVRLSRAAGLRHIEFLSEFFRTSHHACFLDLPAAEEALERTRKVADLSRPLERLYMLWGEGQVDVVRGRAERALPVMRRAQEVAESIGSPAHRLIGWTLLGAPLVLSERFDEAETMAQEGLRFGASKRVQTWDAVFLMLIAWARLERGDISGARRFAGEALQRGQDGTAPYLRWLYTGGRRMLEFALREGLDTELVRALIRRFRYTPIDASLEQWPWPIRVYTLGRFEVLVEDRALVFARKAPRKPLALLQCLIAAGGDQVSDERIADAMWPDAEGDEAAGRLGLTLHRLRELLGDHDAIVLQGARLSLNKNRVWVDALHLDHALTSNRPVPWHLYRGDFLASEREEHWMLPLRERLRSLHQHRRSAEPLPEHAAAIRNPKETPSPLA
jgi:LuxR family maltose regulon positive regulatory protein